MILDPNFILRVGLALLSAAVLSFAVTPLVKRLAQKVGAMDVPTDSRRMHHHPIPRMGGLAIFIAFLASVLIFAYPEIDREIRGILLGAVIIVILGVLDDIITLHAGLKFVVQILAAVLVVLHGCRIEHFVGLHLADWLSYPVSVVWIVAITNAVNFIDGLDGLAAGVSAISAGAMLVVALLVGDFMSAVMLAAIVGACVGFIPYNFNPAKIFMGDTGSTFLGFMLSTISIYGLFKMYAIISFAVPFLVLGLPIFDTAFAIVRRVARGQSPMTPDRGHIHHRMMDMGLNQKQTVAALYVVSSLLGLSAVVLTTSGELKAMLLLLTLAAVAYVASRVIFPREIAETAHEKELEQEGTQAQPAAPAPEEKEEKHEEN